MANMKIEQIEGIGPSYGEKLRALNLLNTSHDRINAHPYLLLLTRVLGSRCLSRRVVFRFVFAPITLCCTTIEQKDVCAHR